MEMEIPEEIPFTGFSVEEIARDIVMAARDNPEPTAVVRVFFKSAGEAQRVIDCLNGRYQSIYARKIEINLYN